MYLARLFPNPELLTLNVSPLHIIYKITLMMYVCITNSEIKRTEYTTKHTTQLTIKWIEAADNIWSKRVDFVLLNLCSPH